MQFFKQMMLVAGIAGALLAQEDTIRGYVTSAETRDPLPGATVTLPVANVQATTDASGNFLFAGLKVATLPHSNAAQTIQTSFDGTNLLFNVESNNEQVRVDLFDLSGRFVSTPLNQRVDAGTYRFNPLTASLTSGTYVLHASIGSRSVSMKIANVAGKKSAATHRLQKMSAQQIRQTVAKSAAAKYMIDTIVVSMDGYKTQRKPIASYTGRHAFTLAQPVVAQDMGVDAEDGYPLQIPWGTAPITWIVFNNGKGVEFIHQMKTEPINNDTYNNIRATKVVAIDEDIVQYSAWGIGYDGSGSSDMSSWEGGRLHVALKGTAPDVGISIGWEGGQGQNRNVSAKEYGYAADGEWHVIDIPFTEFGYSVDLEHITMFIIFALPPAQGEDYMDYAGTYYIFDDVCWKAPVTTTK